MKRVKAVLGSATLVAASVFNVFLLGGVAKAAVDTCTWTGGGADNNFSTAANWTGCDNGNVPENGDTLDFDVTAATAGPDILVNDMSSLSIGGLVLSGDNLNGDYFQVNGNPITITGDITGTQISGTLNLNVDVTLGASVTYSVPNSAVGLGINSSTTLDLQANDLTFDNTTVACGTHILSGLAGSGDIITTASADGLVLRGASAGFTGWVTSNGAGLMVYEGALTDPGNYVDINGSGALYLYSTADASFNFPITLNSTGNPSITAGVRGFACSGGPGTPTKYTTTLTGSLILDTDSIFNGYNDLDVSGATYTTNGHTLSIKAGSQGSVITDSGTVEPQPTTVTVNQGDDQPSTFITINNLETYVINGVRGDVQVNSGGVLKGTGTVGTVNIWDGGKLAPGQSPGCLNSGDLTFNGGTFEVEVGGTTACSGYDQQIVTGAVDIGSTTALTVTRYGGFTPAVGNSFTIISNDSNDAVTGTFSGMAEGATFTQDGVTYRINYAAGDGNDVVLTVTAVPAAPNTGIAQATKSFVWIMVISMVALAGSFVLSRRRETNK